MKETLKDSVYSIIYESVGDFFQHTNYENPPATMNSSNQSNYREVKGNSAWRYGVEESKEKYHKTRFDPEKGKKICEEAVKKIKASSEYKKHLSLAMTYRKKIRFEDHGSRLSVPKAIAGEDKYFSVFKNTKRPIVKIAINICGSACVNDDDFRKVAEAAIPTIYMLEQAGISTEVWYTSFSAGTHPTIKYTGVHVKIKSAQQRFNWTTFAPVFCLGSYRESIFLSWIYSEHGVGYGLGTPMESRDIKKLNNFGYNAVIGLNSPGPMKTISELFDIIKKTSA